MIALIFFVISTLLTFGITALCLKFYGNDFDVKWGIFKRMIFLNWFTSITLSFIFFHISALFSIIDFDKEIQVQGNLFLLTVLSIVLFIELFYYYCFWKETHYRCPNCGSRHTLKLDDSDGEYFSMDFNCRECGKTWNIPNSSIGGWPD